MLLLCESIQCEMSVYVADRTRDRRNIIVAVDRGAACRVFRTESLRHHSLPSDCSRLRGAPSAARQGDYRTGVRRPRAAWRAIRQRLSCVQLSCRVTQHVRATLYGRVNLNG